MESMMMRPLQWPLWMRAVVFKMGWLALVLWQNLAIVPVFFVLAWVWWDLLRRQKIPTLRAILQLSVAGLVMDVLLVWLGWLSFTDQTPWYYMVLWLWFATAWHWCFRFWFGDGVALVLFSCLVPLAYLGGAELGGGIAISAHALYALGPLWFCLLTLNQLQIRQPHQGL